ncbi:tetratricopeptide repeat protein [Streptomyces sp. NPDC056056]|uniref:tetratricopeptide repeat protein n=1 Tax=Streptomyces sp. NPDC056056 TaxID=3345698 RepID=UPI0035D6C9AE
MRAEQYRLFTHHDGERQPSQTHDHSTLGSRVLENINPLLLSRLWSQEEVDRAKLETDGRISSAIAFSNLFGIAEYVASGPRLFQTWTLAWGPNGNPRGAALVAAAVDCARAGITDALPSSLLEKMHTIYLDRAGGDLLRPEPLDAAFAWAEARRYGITSLLLPVSGGTHYRAFDYLPDALSRASEAPSIPESSWELALQHSISAGSGFHVGMAAVRNGKFDIAERAWAASAEAGSSTAHLNLGVLYMKTGRREDAIATWNSALESGIPGAAVFLGKAHEEDGNVREAVTAYRDAAAQGDRHAFVHLAAILPNPAESLEWWKRAADGDETGNMAHNVAVTLDELGRIQESEEWYKKAAEAGSDGAMNNYGLILIEKGEETEGRSWVERSASTGNLNAMKNWGEILFKRGDEEAAKIQLEDAISRGSVSAYHTLGSIASKNGDIEGAVQYWRRGHEGGDFGCSFNLGVNLQKNGDIEEAKECFLVAASPDSYREAHSTLTAKAAYNLAFILIGEAQLEEAEIFFRVALPVANSADICSFGRECAAAGFSDAAVHWLNLSLMRGHKHAACPLAGQLVGDIGLDDLKRLYHIALSDGHAHAAESLAFILASSGHGKEAARTLRLSAIADKGSRPQSNAKRRRRKRR